MYARYPKSLKQFPERHTSIKSFANDIYFYSCDWYKYVITNNELIWCRHAILYVYNVSLLLVKLLFPFISRKRYRIALLSNLYKIQHITSFTRRPNELLSIKTFYNFHTLRLAYDSNGAKIWYSGFGQMKRWIKKMNRFVSW